jgi:hypothetical protein
LEAYDQAKACGQTGESCAIEPYRLCPSEDGRYSVRLATPFSRVASSVLESLKSGRRGRTLERGNANRWGIGIYVLPAAASPVAGAIALVAIKRQGRIIQPLTTTVGPMTMTMPDGSSKQLARGYFVFPIELFDATHDIEIMLSGSHGKTTCEVTRSRLAALR